MPARKRPSPAKSKSKATKQKAAPKSKAAKQAKAKTAPKPKTSRQPKRKPGKPFVPPEDKEPTAKQHLFINWYVSAEVNCNGTEAARRAGYKGSYTTLASVAAENLQKPNIRKRIDQKLAEAARGAEVTVENVLKDLQHVFDLGVQNAQLGAAVRAKELQGKYLKMFTERIEHVQTMDDMSTEDLVNLLQDIAESGSLDLGKLLAGDGPQKRGVSDPAGTETTH